MANWLSKPTELDLELELPWLPEFLEPPELELWQALLPKRFAATMILSISYENGKVEKWGGLPGSRGENEE